MAAAIAVGLFCIPASAASSGQIQLRGVVPAVCTVAVSETGANLDLVQGQAQVPVAAVEERCNSANGYTVAISSRNGGQLRTESGGAGVGYTLHYGDASGTAELMTDRSVSNSARRGTLAVTVPGDRTLPAGEYTDIVTVSISAK